MTADVPGTALFVPDRVMIPPPETDEVGLYRIYPVTGWHRECGTADMPKSSCRPAVTNGPFSAKRLEWRSTSPLAWKSGTMTFH
ncbi:MAG: hypothetical protein ACP5C4_08675, partial [Methanomicrobiales archaeon]